MNGLYLNASPPVDLLRVLGSQPEQIEVSVPGLGRVRVLHHPALWPSGPVFRDADADLVAVVSGWFLIDGKFNDLPALARRIGGALDAGDPVPELGAIEGGAFLAVVAHRGRVAILTDPFGLHPHFAPEGDAFAGLAPLPGLFPDAKPDPFVSGIVRKQGYAFGNLTGISGVQRLPPGSLIEPERTRRAFSYHGTPSADVRDTFRVLQELLARFPGATRILPLSGGLDSRLILAAGRFQYGYTFGPADTGDRSVAATFADDFTDYDAFSLLELDYPASLRRAGRELLRGLVDRPFVELLAVYRRLVSRWGRGHLFFDGYAGDVLQRFSLVHPLGPGSWVTKAWPGVLGNLEPMRGLLKRYPGLVGRERRLLEQSYQDTVGGMDLNPHQRLVLYELLAGRGARYALTGGTLLSSLYFTPVQPFYLLPVFRDLFGADPGDTMRYKSLRSIWSAVPDKYADVPTYAGFRPQSNPDRSRLTLLVRKVLAKANLVPGAASYEKELPLVTWSDTEDSDVSG